MDLNRIYSNPGLEARRLALLRRLRAEEVLRDAHEGSGSIARQIELGFGSFESQKKTPLTLWISQCAQTLDATERNAFRTLLLAVAPAAIIAAGRAQARRRDVAPGEILIALAARAGGILRSLIQCGSTARRAGAIPVGSLAGAEILR